MLIPWEPKLRDSGGCWLYQKDGVEIRIWNARLHKDGELNATLWIYLPDGRLFPESGAINLASAQTRKKLAKQLEEHHPGANWLVILSALYMELSVRLVEGEPAVRIKADGQTYPVPYVVRPLLPEDEVSIVYGWGGVGKGWLALLLARGVVTGKEPPGLPLIVEKTGNVLYLDYETSEKELRRRWNLICGPSGHELVYRRCERPIAEDADAVTKLVVDADPALIIIDSAGLAAGGDLNAPQSAIELFRALRPLKRTILLIAHAPKNATEPTVFGSAFFTNLARNVWELRAEAEPGTEEVTLALVHRKSNVSGLHPPIAFTLRIGDTVQVRPTSVELAPVPQGAEEEIYELLKGGPLSVADIRAATGRTPDSVQSALQRLKRKGKVKHVGHGVWERVDPEDEDAVPF